MHLYIFYVSPNGKFRQNRRNGTCKPVPYMGAAELSGEFAFPLAEREGKVSPSGDG